MNVSSEVARTALQATGHNVRAAMEYLLEHPELREEDTPPPPTLERQQSAELRNL
eukprot:CAMPEP_0205910986 /NCGR_PEP_ID=MMETSP1325-20131115/4834_1 /ASSEMBLY_ACC=CAM_ASM_000708 /TAXON_ID=236786 /ORGANISM="Florenciella sp., Strain RCC1007" /LENGTH=54 /DNA_ID=CAMNT_0053277433 /DNA_START=11 /DNA_END=172 /DNA_ORIENTATION=+